MVYILDPNLFLIKCKAIINFIYRSISTFPTLAISAVLYI